MSSTTLCITQLASEWKSSKGGLSTINRELAIQLAKHPNVSVTFFVPKCSDEDKQEASKHNVTILEAKELPGFTDVDWLAFPPKDLKIDFVVGHDVILGKQAQIIRDSHHCKWMQVVHTIPDELAMYKTYLDAIPKGDKKQWVELELCERADVVVAIGPKLKEFYSAFLSFCQKEVYNFTPGIFNELYSLNLSSESHTKFRIIIFGRGDSEDFKLKGFDIAAKAVAALNDKRYHLIFVGAPSESASETQQVKEKLLKQGLYPSQLTVKGYLENREKLKWLLCASNLAIIPSRTEGFGLTALEALSAGLPFLVSQNSGFGEALLQGGIGSSFIIDSENPEHWAKAIEGVRQKGSERATQECQELRTRYANKYSWDMQCNKLVEIMLSLVHIGQPSCYSLRDNSAPITVREKTTLYYQQGAKPMEKSSSGRESTPSSTGATNLTDQRSRVRDHFEPITTRETTTPFHQQEARPNEPSSRESASSSSGANNSPVTHQLHSNYLFFRGLMMIFVHLEYLSSHSSGRLCALLIQPTIQ